ncbi:peptide/nickel transport system permease protein [Roseomonas rosea]|uniref:Peptide/nickel transport system permease protein n=1 Tax=Muricoccus roseus TaxID=198092 RepID=A0A1M6LUP3_9PROT|nr:ABC transporter permease [Roseomonas rosea]SHJ74889.1 peptide/nickel transport system permease protein [Roseomonas rosea]
MAGPGGGGSRWRFLGRRALQGIPTILLIVTFNFFLLRLAPGDPATVMAGEAGAATPEYMAQLRAQFGLDRPLALQYASYVWNILRLDFGYSFRYQESNLSLILGRMSATLLLMGASVLLSVGLGTLLGLIAAVRRNRIEAALILLATVLAYASPIFWLGLMFIVVFAIQLGWVPTSGMTTVGGPGGGMAHVLDVLHHLVLPAVTLSLFYMALYTRLMRASVLENLRMNYVVTARAKGVPPRRLVFRHVLRNAVLPIVTMAGVQIGGALGGSVVVESVFGWPGLGQLAFEALFARDLNLLLGILTLSSVVVVIANLLVDLVHSIIDPRVALA